MPALTIDSLDDPLAFERVESFQGGVDLHRRATLLAPDESQKLVNIIIRDNAEAGTRPGADALGDAKVDGTNAIKGLFYFDTPSNQQLLAATNAKIYRWGGASWVQATGWTPTAGSRVEMVQGVDKVLLTDGVQNMQSYDGTAFTDLGSGANSPPKKATLLCWHTGRMFASGQPENPDTIWLSTRLDFGVGAWNSTIRSFRIGGGEGDPIMALASLQGFVLAVMKESSIWLVYTDPQAEPADFQASQSAESLSYGVGCVGKHAWCMYGNDLLFMSQDGVRSIRRMEAATGQYELSAAISEPIQPYIDRINPNCKSIISATKYLEFALFAVPLDSSQTNNAVLVWNGRLGKWIGVWEGWTPAEWSITKFDGEQHLTFGDNYGYVNQWKDTESSTDDDTYLDNGSSYETKLWTRSFLFGDPVVNKNLYNAILRFTAGNAIVTLTAMTDVTEARVWATNFQPTGDLLGVGVLNPLPGGFLLQATSPITVKRGLRGLRDWNEAYLKIETTAGWYQLRNVTLGAFINALKEGD